MNVSNLVKQFKSFQNTGRNPLSFDELQFLCENEEHEAFMVDYNLYSDIMDERDNLEEELY